MSAGLRGTVQRGLAWSPFVTIAFTARVISAASLFFLMRKLSPEAFGHYAYFQVSTGYIAGFALLGLEVSSNVLSAQAGDSTNERNIVYFSAFAVALGSIVFVLPLFNIAYIGLHPARGSGAGAAESYAAEAALVFQGVTGGLLAGRGLNLYVASINTLLSAGFLISCLVLPPSADAIIVSYIALQWIGFVLNVLVYRMVAAGKFYPVLPRWAVMRRLATFGMRNGGAALAVSMVQLSTQTRMLSTQGVATLENAKYTFASQVYNILIFAPALLAPVLINRISRLRDETERFAVCTKLAIGFAIASGVALACTMVGVRLVVMFLPSVYQEAYYSVGVSALAALCGFVKSPLSIFFVSSLRTLPDTLGAFLGSSGALLILACVDSMDADRGSELRFLVQATQLAIVLIFFIAARQRRSDEVVDLVEAADRRG